MIDASIAAQPSYFVAGYADSFWLMVCGFLVFFMQCGFALLEAGSIRAKNTKNILFKNLLDACVGALVWWSVGYMIAVNSQKTLYLSLPLALMYALAHNTSRVVVLAVRAYVCVCVCARARRTVRGRLGHHRWRPDVLIPARSRRRE